jgi:fatty acid/phospholipid biosynthesis enzyme
LKITNAADTAGGGPIWAVNGLAIKAHGRSNYDAVAGGLIGVKALVEKDIVGALKKDLAAIKARLNVPGQGQEFGVRE